MSSNASVPLDFAPPPETLRSDAARLLGQARSPKKAAAARQNGKRGARPPGIPQTAETKAKISANKRQR